MPVTDKVVPQKAQRIARRIAGIAKAADCRSTQPVMRFPRWQVLAASGLMWAGILAAILAGVWLLTLPD